MSWQRFMGVATALVVFGSANPVYAQHCSAWEQLAGPQIGGPLSKWSDLFKLVVQVPVDDPGWKAAPHASTVAWVPKKLSGSAALTYFQTVVVCPDRAVSCRLRVSGVAGRLEVRVSSKQYSTSQLLATISDGKEHIVELTPHLTRGGFSRLLLVHGSDGKQAAVPVAVVEFDGTAAAIKFVETGFVATRIKMFDKTPIHYESIPDPPLVVYTVAKPQKITPADNSASVPAYPSYPSYNPGTVPYSYPQPTTTTYRYYYTVPTYTYRTIYYYYYVD